MTNATSSDIFAAASFLGVISFFCALIFLYVYRVYFVEAQRLNLRFRLFELKDRLQAMAVNRKIHEESEEYVFLRECIDSFILNLEKAGFFALLEAVMNASRTSNNKALVAKIKDNPEIAKLYSEAYLLFREVVYKNSLVLKCILMLVSYVNFFRNVIDRTQLRRLAQLADETTKLRRIGKDFLSYC